MQQQLNDKITRVCVERDLLDAVRGAFPESRGMTYSGLVDWALRVLLKKQGGAA